MRRIPFSKNEDRTESLQSEWPLVEQVKRLITLLPLMLNQPFSFNALGKNCDGVNYDRSCCSDAAPCAINEGDCDENSDCQGNLICGKDNCQPPFPLSADCCELPLVTNPFSKKILVAIVYKIKHKSGYRACGLLKKMECSHWWKMHFSKEFLYKICSAV